jgi:hypothetical protein
MPRKTRIAKRGLRNVDPGNLLKKSGQVMEQLHAWLEVQFAEKKTEPNWGLGKAITAAALERTDRFPAACGSAA